MIGFISWSWLVVQITKIRIVDVLIIIIKFQVFGNILAA